MASSSSLTARNVQRQPTIKKLNDSLYELYKPPTGFIDIEIIFFHGFQLQSYEEAYLTTWMLPEHSECWLNTWLPQEFPQARILSVSYDSSTQVSDSAGRIDMYLVGENLGQSIIGLERIGQTCPVVLVGHCIGGLVLKQVCLQAEQMGARDMGCGINLYKTFLGNMKGTFFYSTPNSGSRARPNKKQKAPLAPLMQYLELLSKDAARLNDSFAKLRHQRGWKTSGVCEANETEDCNTVIRMAQPRSSLIGQKREYSLVVEEASARYDVDNFCVLSGEDNFTICKPRDRTSSSFLLLVEFLWEIVRIERMVKEHWRTTLRLPSLYVALPQREEWVLTLLQLGAEQPSRIALVGMGGIGKTTLAKAVLIQIQPQFDLVCFVEDVKGGLKRHNISYLVADNLYYGNGRKFRLQDGDAQSLWLHLLGKKVLIILDDVESEDQISEMLSTSWWGTESRLIVTSRIQSRELMPTFSMFEVPLLYEDESEVFFLEHIDDDVIGEIPKDLIDKVVRKCEGLPLTLQVIGSYLRFEKTVGVWTSALDKLTRAESLNGTVNDRLWAKLKVCFDELASFERKMFLDLAVFDEYDPSTTLDDFSSTKLSDLEIWKASWENEVNGSSVDSGLRNLVDRSFIHLNALADTPLETVHSPSSKVTILRMHEQLRDLGKSISRPSDEKVEMCRGVWRPDDVTYLLSKYKGDEAHIEVVSALLDQSTTTSVVHWSSIGKLQKLRLLRLSNVRMIGNESHRFPCNLAFLHLTSCFGDTTRITRIFDILRSKSWPIREEDVEGLQQLSVLCLDNCSSIRLPSNFHRLSKLKVLIIRGNQLKRLPEGFGRISALEVLILENVSLSQLPDSFSQISSLRSLTLKGCSAMKIGFVPNLVRWGDSAPRPLCRLTDLRLENLQDLRELPEAFGLLECLETLAIVRCSALKQLPEGLGKLSNLRRLNIVECDRMEFLFGSLGELASLRRLQIRGCQSLCLLPESIGQLQALTNLELIGLNVLTLPESTVNLDKLEFLILQLPHLQRLPETLGQLKALETLWIWHCGGLESLPESVGQLAEIQEISIEWCKSLERLPGSIGQLRKLRKLALHSCTSMASLPDTLGQLTALETLYLCDSEKLKMLPESIGELTSLEVLDLQGSASLEYLPQSIGRLQELRRLGLTGAVGLKTLPESLGQLTALENLGLPTKYKTMAIQGLLTQTVDVDYEDWG